MSHDQSRVNAFLTGVLVPFRQEGSGAKVGLREKYMGALLKVQSPAFNLQALSNLPPISMMCVSVKENSSHSCISNC